VAHQLPTQSGHGRKKSLRRSLKRFLKTPIYPISSSKGIRQASITRITFVAAALVIGLYIELPIIWWFMVAALVVGGLIAVAIRRFEQ
jgi:hypothetical protein